VWHAAIGLGRLQPGQRLLVTGASGGVGSAAVLLAKAMVWCDSAPPYIA